MLKSVPGKVRMIIYLFQYQNFPPITPRWDEVYLML